MQQHALIFLDLRRAEGEYPTSRRKLQQLIKEGRLKAFRLDGKIIIKREDLERVLTATPVDRSISCGVDEAARD
jgi:hypothetical protein